MDLAKRWKGAPVLLSLLKTHATCFPRVFIRLIIDSLLNQATSVLSLALPFSSTLYKDVNDLDFY
jgi:hypothetical protein